MVRHVSVPLALAVALLLASAVSAAARGPIEVVTFSDQFTDVNPCTGMEHEISLEITIRLHEFELEKPGRHHFNNQFFLDVTTSDGFSGRAVGPDIDNGTGLFEDEEGTGMFKALLNGVLRNPETGQKFRVHLNVTFVQVRGDVKVFTEDFVTSCLGRAA